MPTATVPREACTTCNVYRAANLKKLVPMAGYEQMAVGVIRSSVLSGNGIRLQAEVDSRVSYGLTLDPAAYDVTSGELALSKCEFSLTQTTFKQPDDVPTRQNRHNFQTQVTLRPGEYTVIGTVGGDPVFVVLRLSKA